ncbi:MAG: MerR family transcriptional regulator, partial [Actinocrinis sp.]
MAGARGSANGTGTGTRGEGRAGVGATRAGGRNQAAAGARTLTIGEASARLSAEFPGVTTGVLRRMEAVGSFTAGRGESGYRRYSEADLDLIRLVLAHHQAMYEEHHAQSAADGPGGWSGDGPDPADLSGAESPLTHPAASVDAQSRDYAGAGSARAAGTRTATRTARTGSSRSASRSGGRRAAEALRDESHGPESAA